MRRNAITRFLMVAGLLVLFGCGQSSSTPESATSSGGNSAASAGQDQKAAEPVPAPRPPVVVDAGTAIAVTIDQTISSKTSNSGDHFDASLAAPVMVGDEQVIPSGARVSGTVTVSKSAGKFKGNAELGVTLDSITVNGQAYSVRTSAITESGKGRGKRTAIGAGGGAAVGAIIGALAGGGKGAAIGAGAGAGAGTAGTAFTGNRDITISAETRLNFKLREPLEIRGK
jgi:hypothetical protein